MFNIASTKIDKSKISLKEVIVVSVIYLCVISFILRVQLETGFNILTGDRYDGLIENSLLEHWYNVFRGKSAWNIVGYFSPYPNTLGYNDGYFLYGLIASFFRFSGIDIFLSAELVNIVLRTIGYYSFYALCRRCIGLKPFLAITGASIFTLNNNLVLQSGHAQLLSVALSPLLTLLLYRYMLFLTSGNSRKKAILYGSASGILLGSWLLSTFYMAWFFIFFTMILTIFIVLISYWEKRRHNESFIRPSFNAYEIIIPAIVTLLSFLPFLIVYLQSAKKVGVHHFGEVLSYTPRLTNLLNPGDTNFLFGKLSQHYFSIFPPNFQLGGEFMVGFPPVILIVSLVSLIYFFKNSAFTIESVLIRSLLLAVILSLLLMIKFGNHTLWKLVWELVPGAKGMRVTARYALFLNFPITVLVVYFLGKVARYKYKGLTIILACLLIMEQINLGRSQWLNRQEQLNFIKQAEEPPPSCRSFFVSGQRLDESLNKKDDATYNVYAHNVDAMLLSEIFALRTINGFSTFNPSDWDFGFQPHETYISRVDNYINKHHIQTGLCEYDLYTSRWHTHTGISTLPLKVQ
ncbi:hypothetical protein ACL2XO_18545 [Sodalis sp. RH15]|uniref:hypothetical protein n=1 Tax=Sodalis sp. RH15 TaxID=3394330 RepID=UPI0039B5D8BE